MKRNIGKTITVAAITLLLGAGATLAMDHSKMNQGGSHMAGAMADTGGRMGTPIHSSKLDMGACDYNLIDNAAQMDKAAASGAKMDHSKMEMKSNHLMVYPVDKTGKAISGAKVGFQVTGPNGALQQAMAMEMTGGYGADVDFKTKGKYEVKMKLVKGDMQMMDTFSYEVK